MTNQIVLTNAEWTNTVQRTYRAMVAPSIAFKPAFAVLTGSTTAALLLSQAYYWSDGRTTQDDGWFYKTSADWEEELCLTYREQDTARGKLRAIHLLAPDGETEIPIWEEKVKGVPGKLHFRVNEVALALALTIMQANGASVGGYVLVAPDCQLYSAHDIQKRETRSDKSAILGSRNARLYIQESTTEITTEINHAPAQATNGNQPAAQPVDMPEETAAPVTLPGPGRNDLMGGRKQRAQYGVQAKINEYVAKAKALGLDMPTWVAYYNRLAEICGMQALIDQEDNEYDLATVRNGALKLLGLELRNVEALNALASLWIAENGWRSNPTPSIDALAKFQSQKLAEVKAQAAKATTKATLDESDPKIEVEEWLGMNSDWDWWPTTMRRSRYQKLLAEGRKIRLAQAD